MGFPILARWHPYILTRKSYSKSDHISNESNRGRVWGKLTPGSWLGSVTRPSSSKTRYMGMGSCNSGRQKSIDRVSLAFTTDTFSSTSGRVCAPPELKYCKKATMWLQCDKTHGGAATAVKQTIFGRNQLSTHLGPLKPTHKLIQEWNSMMMLCEKFYKWDVDDADGSDLWWGISLSQIMKVWF